MFGLPNWIIQGFFIDNTLSVTVELSQSAFRILATFIYILGVSGQIRPQRQYIN